MTDRPSEQCPCPDSDTGHSDNIIHQATADLGLDYPRLLVNASFSSLLQHSYPINTTSAFRSSTTGNMPIPSLSTSALGESWATLSDSSYAGEDDLQSENTDMGSLVDVHSSSDMQSVEDLDTSSESGFPYSHEEPPALQISNTTARSTEAFDSESRTDSTPAQSQLLEVIEFSEPEEWPETGRADLKYTLKVFTSVEGAQLSPILSGTVDPVQLHGTIRMTMSRHALQIDQPFRVLFSGAISESRAQILRKIGDALVSAADFTSNYRSMDFSRYHVVPLEFGPGSTSNQAEMIPIQTQIIVDDCIDASCLEESDEYLPITLSMRRGDVLQSRWDGVWQNLQERRRWTAPNIAVIFLGQDDSPATKEKARLVYECMRRHHVPTLVIAEESTWKTHSPPWNLDQQTLHRCIELTASDVGSRRVLRRLPVDLDSFINLEPEQLNKHFACLADLAAARTHASRKSVSFASLSSGAGNSSDSNDVEKNLSKSIMAQHQPYAMLRNVLPLKEGTVVLLLWLFVAWIFVAVPFAAQQSVQSRTAGSVNSTTSITLSSSSLSPTTSIASQTGKGSLVPGMRGQTDLAELLSNHALQSMNTSDKFMVDIIGDCHIVVKAPRTMMQKRKQPEIRVRVTRGNVEILANTSRLFEGVYAVKISREDAHGLLNATISVAKSSVQQTFEVNFGNTFEKPSLWDLTRSNFTLHHVRKVSERVQNLLRTWSERTNLTVLFENGPGLTLAGQGSHILNRGYEVLTKLYGNAEETRALFVDQSRRRAETIKTLLVPKAQDIWVKSVAHAVKASGAIRVVAEDVASQFKEHLQDIAARMSAIDVSRTQAVWQDFTQSEMLAKAQERARKTLQEMEARLDRLLQQYKARAQGDHQRHRRTERGRRRKGKPHI